MNIGFVGYTPASVNSYERLISNLGENGYKVRTLLYHKCGVKQWGVDYKYIDNLNDCDIYKVVEEDIKGLDIVVYNLSGGKVDNMVSKVSKDLGIYSIGTIDTFWEDNIERLIANRFKLGLYPDTVVVTSTYNLQELSKVIPSNIVQWGNVHTDRLLILKDKLKNYDELIGEVNFFSQPNGVGACEPTSDESKQMVIQLEKLISLGLIKGLNIYIHPRESSYWYDKKGYELKRALDYMDSIRGEYIVSASSTIIYESLSIGKKGYKYCTNLEERFKERDYDTYSSEDIVLGGSIERWVDGVTSIYNKIKSNVE